MTTPNRPEAGNMQMTDEQEHAIAHAQRVLRAVKLYDHAELLSASKPAVTEGWKLVPVEPTETMVVDGFESWPSAIFSNPKDWGAFESMSGCQQAAHKARLCYAAMLAASPAAPPQSGEPVVSIFDTNVTLRQYRSPEPTLRECVHLYYKKHGMNEFEATNLTREYFEALNQAAPQPSPTAVAHDLLAALIDIYDDGTNNALEDRCYVEGTWKETMDEARAYLAATAAAPSPAQTERGAVAQWQSRVRNVASAEWINITEEGAATIRGKYSDSYELRALVDRAALQAAPATEKSAEPVYAYIYEYETAFGLHRQLEPGTFNGADPTRTVKVYAAPQPAADAPGMAEPVATVVLDDERAAFGDALFDYGMAFSTSVEPGEIKAARERVVSMFASRVARIPSEEEVIAAAETSWSTVSFDENGHSIYHFEKEYLQRFAKNLFADADAKRYASADDLDAEIHRLLEMKIERFPAYAKSLLEGYATKVEVFDHMIQVAKAAGFESLTEAISVAKKARAVEQTRALTELVMKWERWQDDGDRRGCPSTNGLSTAISDLRALLTAAQPASGADHD